MLAVAFGSISFMTYAISFWAPPYAIRTFYGAATAPAQFIGASAAEEVATILGWGAAIAAAIGVIMGGVISDLWRRRDPRGRIFVNMLAVVLPIPAVWTMFTTDNLGTFYIASPIAQLFGSAWVGAAVATLQDVVLPRMRATAGATYVLGTTMVGLALGPYFAGKMADVTHSLSAGVFCLYVVPPFTLVALWIGSRRHRRPRSHQGRARPRRRRADLTGPSQPKRRRRSARRYCRSDRCGSRRARHGSRSRCRRHRAGSRRRLQMLGPAMVKSSRPVPSAPTSRLGRSPR